MNFLGEKVYDVVEFGGKKLDCVMNLMLANLTIQIKFKSTLLKETFFQKSRILENFTSSATRMSP